MKTKIVSLALLIALPFSASADRLDQMISPISNPVNFEDPRINTELRPIFMYHQIGEDFITGGGDVQLYALQFRWALNDRLAFIATKDGYIDFNPDEVLTDETGFANVTPGLKYVLTQDREAGEIITAGLRYEIPLGNTDVLQGKGDGQFNPFLSAAYAIGDLNLMAGTGFRLPLDDADSTFYDFDIHLDLPVGDFYPTLEVNVVHVLDGGERLPIADEGQDLFNFGSTEAGGKTLVTMAAGARYRFTDSVDGGIAYQFPLTDGAGSNITDYRITADLIISFDLPSIS